jgi:hypothetical protein
VSLSKLLASLKLQLPPQFFSGGHASDEAALLGAAYAHLAAYTMERERELISPIVALSITPPSPPPQPERTRFVAKKGFIQNLTQHEIVVREDGSPYDVVFEPNGAVARVKTTQTALARLHCPFDDGHWDFIPIMSKPVYGTVEGIPEDSEDILVSTLVAQALEASPKGYTRGNVYTPDSGPESAIFEKDADGKSRMVAVKRLSQWDTCDPRQRPTKRGKK